MDPLLRGSASGQQALRNQPPELPFRPWHLCTAGFNVYRTYNAGTPMPAIDNATFAEMQQVRH